MATKPEGYSICKQETNSAKSGANLFIVNSKRIVGLLQQELSNIKYRNRKSFKLNIFLNLPVEGLLLQEITLLLTGFCQHVL
ncbi:AVN_HP_G0120110.mRNA.1.CDS.1 [Saccharomyces cerevisiae]|nr:AVN_HP_G0120110.mRNA.1.CDS.1 [Saccharomyces cerevisiae]CAI6997196.1 AVN_HP_G0120110.mRNA.1.CDS.1 [Saccharomyces cerevisiae]